MRFGRLMRTLIPLMREVHFFIIALHWSYTSHIGRRIPLHAVAISLDAWSNPYPWAIYCDTFPDDFDSNGYWRSYGYSLGHLTLYMVALSYLWAMAWIMAVVVTDHLATLGNRSLLVDLHIWELGTSGILCSFVSSLILSFFESQDAAWPDAASVYTGSGSLQDTTFSLSVFELLLKFLISVCDSSLKYVLP